MNDILLDNGLDIAVSSGDFVWDDAEQQHQELILIANPGAFRRSPVLGVGIARFYKSHFTLGQIDQLKQRISLQMQYDGYQQVSTTINSFNDIQIQAER